MASRGHEDERNRRLERLFDEVLGLPPEERAGHLASRCPDDDEMRRELEELLAADAGSNGLTQILETPLAIPPIRLGSRVGQYVIIRQLGAGNMGEVFLARHTGLDRLVAIKFLSVLDADMRRRFADEARIIARCRHDHIVVIHDVDIHAGIPFMVFEYLEGETLRDHVAGGPIAPDRALVLITGVVRALCHAHAAGIVHRDLKPANIMITRQGEVKVLDFGIAQLRDPDPAHARTIASHAHATRTPGRDGGERDDVIAGTPLYMAPEQWGPEHWERGGLDAGIDARTDLWAVGLILCELIAGHHPLGESARGRSIDDVRALVCDRTTPVLRRDQELPIPGPLRAIVERCLRKRKSERFPSADELLHHLRRERAAVAELGDPASDPALQSTHEVPAGPGGAPRTSASTLPSDAVQAENNALFLDVAVTGSEATRNEYEAIHRALGERAAHIAFSLVASWRPRATELVTALLAQRPVFVHLTARGAANEGIHLCREDGTRHRITDGGAVAIFSAYSPRLVSVNACLALEAARLLTAHVDFVLVIESAMPTHHVHAFLALFYRALILGHSVVTAFRSGLVPVELEGDTDARPHLLVRQNADPDQSLLPPARPLVQFKVTVEGQATPDEIRALLADLRAITTDHTLVCRGVTRGSIVLHLTGTCDGYATLQRALQGGHLTDWLGRRVSAVEQDPSEEFVPPFEVVAGMDELPVERRGDNLALGAFRLPLKSLPLDAGNAELASLLEPSGTAGTGEQARSVTADHTATDDSVPTSWVDTIDPEDTLVGDVTSLFSTGPPLLPDLMPEIHMRQYKMDALIGMGGMASVYRARDVLLDRDVAIKVIDDEESMLRETSAHMSCRHENLVALYEAFEHDGWYCLVFEYLEGCPLTNVLGRSAIFGRDAARLMLPVVRALKTLHDRGFIHGDIKTSNIFLCTSGTVKLLDLGLARLISQPSPDNDDASIMGTLPYMAPEALETSRVDQRADLWSVGIVLHESITGTVPERDLSMHELAAQRVNLDLAMPSLADQISGLGDLVTIVDRCLRKRKEERYSSAKTLLADLEHYLSDTE